MGRNSLTGGRGYLQESTIECVKSVQNECQFRGRNKDYMKINFTRNLIEKKNTIKEMLKKLKVIGKWD